MDAEQRRVLETAFPGQAARYFLPMSIGGTPEHADEGAALILDGTKTLTSSPFWDYPDGKIPFVGALSVLLDGARVPRGIVETMRVEIMPFGAVTEDMARAYGEGERTVQWWRRVIGAWYRASAMRHGAVFTDDTPIIWEWIAVVRRL
jgi:histidinol-phosphate aminotransferase